MLFYPEHIGLVAAIAIKSKKKQCPYDAFPIGGLLEDRDIKTEHRPGGGPQREVLAARAAENFIHSDNALRVREVASALALHCTEAEFYDIGNADAYLKDEVLELSNFGHYESIEDYYLACADTGEYYASRIPGSDYKLPSPEAGMGYRVFFWHPHLSEVYLRKLIFNVQKQVADNGRGSQEYRDRFHLRYEWLFQLLSDAWESGYSIYNNSEPSNHWIDGDAKYLRHKTNPFKRVEYEGEDEYLSQFSCENCGHKWGGLGDFFKKGFCYGTGFLPLPSPHHKPLFCPNCGDITGLVHHKIDGPAPEW